MLSQQHPRCRRDAVGPWGAQLKSDPPPPWLASHCPPCVQPQL